MGIITIGMIKQKIVSVYKNLKASERRNKKEQDRLKEILNYLKVHENDKKLRMIKSAMNDIEELLEILNVTVDKLYWDLINSISISFQEKCGERPEKITVE